MPSEPNDTGLPNDPWRDVYQAYSTENPKNLMPGDATNLATLAKRWEESKDPSTMDAAIRYCQQRELPILPALVKYLDAAMQKRIRDGQAGNKAFREGAKEWMLEEMAKLQYHGATLERAADWAAASQFNQFGLKSSSLEKAYAKDRSRLDKFAREIFEAQKEWPEYEDMQARWKALVETSPNLGPDLKGERR